MISAYKRWLLPFVVALFTVWARQLPAQSVLEPKQFGIREGVSGGVDVGLGLQTNRVNPSVTYYELKSLTRSHTLLVGWTARLSAFYGQELDYYTAPARLTRVAAIDTVHFSRQTQTSLNVGVRAEWHLGRLQLGASVDLLGLTVLGRSRMGQVYSSTGLFTQTDSLGQDQQLPYQGAAVFQQASPTRFNLKLWGDRERGMSTTEVYARVYIVPKVALKVGYQWLSTEIKLANRDVVADNARFRNRVGLPYLALTLPITPW